MNRLNKILVAIAIILVIILLLMGAGIYWVTLNSGSRMAEIQGNKVSTTSKTTSYSKVPTVSKTTSASKVSTSNKPDYLKAPARKSITGKAVASIGRCGDGKCEKCPVGARCVLADETDRNCPIDCEENNKCAPNWQCTVWSACLNGRQSRTCSDGNKCGINSGKPATAQTCLATSAKTCAGFDSSGKSKTYKKGEKDASGCNICVGLYIPGRTSSNGWLPYRGRGCKV